MRPHLDRPFFIVGAPRSGTTFLARVLDRHDDILCTDETRVMTWVNRALNELPADQRTIMTHRDRWLAHLETELPGVVVRFYEGLGAGRVKRWGDKNPHYADPRTDPAALATIDRLFPQSQFIHLVRDGRNVVVSLLAKNWAKNAFYGADVWRRHVEAARAFGGTLEPGRFLELRYEDLVADPVAGFARIGEFLDVGEDAEWVQYLTAGEAARGVSGAITPPERYGAPLWHERLSPEDLAMVEWKTADLLAAYGYESDAWRDEVRARPRPPAPDRQGPRAAVARARALMNSESYDASALRKALRDVLKARRALQDELDERTAESRQLREALEGARVHRDPPPGTGSPWLPRRLGRMIRRRRAP